MHVPVQRDQRLPLLDRSSDCDATDMDVQRDVVDPLAIKSGAVQLRVIGWGMEQEDRSVHGSVSDEGREVALDRRVSRNVRGHRNATSPRLR